MDPVSVDCDICHRPVAMLVREDDGHVRLEGPWLHGADTEAYQRAVLTGPAAATFAASKRMHWSAARGRQRAGAFIFTAAPAGSDRYKLVCVGRKHKLYERAVSGLTATYARASAAGMKRIGMRDVHS